MQGRQAKQTALLADADQQGRGGPEPLQSNPFNHRSGIQADHHQLGIDIEKRSQIADREAVHDFLHSELRDLQTEDLVLMIDALDVWMQLPKEHMISRFDEIAGNQVVIGADKKCWPNDMKGETCLSVPDSTLPEGVFGPLEGQPEYPGGTVSPIGRPKWANSGTIMGTVGHMKKVYQHLLILLEANPNLETDQGIFNDLLAAREITLDYWYRLFYADASDAGNMQFVNVPSPELLSAIPNLLQTTPTPPPCSLRASFFNPPFDLLPTLLIHKRTGQIPALIHFNDHRYKNDIDGLWGIPWFSSSESRFRKIVLDRVINGEGIEFANGTEVTYFDICPQDVLDLRVVDDGTG